MSEKELQTLIGILYSINDNLLSLQSALKDGDISSLNQFKDQLAQCPDFDKKMS